MNLYIFMKKIYLELRYIKMKSVPEKYYEKAITVLYVKKTGQNMNWSNPKTFTEKIQWSKLYDTSSEKTRLSDKYKVREWVERKIGKQYLIPVLGVYKNFDEINFESLPENFVIKTNHGSGWNIIVKDKEKFNIKKAKKKINNWLKKDYAFCSGYEIHYSKIVPRIIVEKYISVFDEGFFLDYRFFCFEGVPKYCVTDITYGKENYRNIYDMDWSIQNIQIHTYRNYPNSIEKPENWDEMKEIATKLCDGFNQVRVDLYSVENKVLFGEMTFTSASGFTKFTPKTVDEEWGKMWVINNEMRDRMRGYRK